MFDWNQRVFARIVFRRPRYYEATRYEFLKRRSINLALRFLFGLAFVL